MKPQTIENAKRMLVVLLEQGASYAEAGKPFGLVRSTVERNVKAFLRGLVADGSVKGLDEDGVTSFSLVRMASREIAAQKVLNRRAQLNQAARRGEYRSEMESA